MTCITLSAYLGEELGGVANSIDVTFTLYDKQENTSK